MCKFKILPVLVLLLSPAVAQPVEFPEFSASYKLYGKGMEVANINRTFQRTRDNHYIYRSESQTTGLVALFRDDHIIEESRWKHIDGQLKPLDYSYKHTGSKKNRDVDIRFDWDKKVIINRVNEHTWKMPLENGVLDKLLYQYAIMVDLQKGLFPDTYTIADGGKMKTYHFERLGEETVTTPLGELETVKILRQKPDDTRRSVFWCAEQFNYLPVKVKHTEDDGLETTAIIQSLSGL